MITKTQQDLLKRAFSDADLIDIDFSRWDEDIELLVITDHVRSKKGYARSLIAFRFHGVREIKWAFHHHDFSKFPLKRNRNQHLNWNIYTSELVSEGKLYRLSLAGSEQFPRLELLFDDVQSEEVPHSFFAEVNPDWSRTDQGLGRPGIEVLHKLWTRRSTPKQKHKSH